MNLINCSKAKNTHIAKIRQQIVAERVKHATTINFNNLADA
jgi:hypothetical protein